MKPRIDPYNPGRCLSCHRVLPFHSHHRVFKSQGGEDGANESCLCFKCHRSIHAGELPENHRHPDIVVDWSLGPKRAMEKWLDDLVVKQEQRFKTTVRLLS